MEERYDRRAGGANRGTTRRSTEAEVATLFTFLAGFLIVERILAVPGREFRFAIRLLPVPSIEIGGSSRCHDCLQLAGTRVPAGQHDGDPLTRQIVRGDGGETGGAGRFEEDAEAA